VEGGEVEGDVIMVPVHFNILIQERRKEKSSVDRHYSYFLDISNQCNLFFADMI